MRILLLSWLVTAATSLEVRAEVTPGVEAEPPSYDRPVIQPRQPREVVVDIPGERSRTNKLVLVSMLGVGKVVAGIGVYYHLDSRTQSHSVSADVFTGKVWTQDRADIVDRAGSSRTRAAIAYGVGGGLIAIAAVAYHLTEPAAERTVIRPQASIMPTRDGAIVSRTWSW